MKDPKKKRELLNKAFSKKRRGPDKKPREIDLNALPYYPLPPAPDHWDIHIYAPFVSAEDFFEVDEGSKITIERINKIEMENRPDPAYRTSKLQSSGVLVIDKTGKSRIFSSPIYMKALSLYSREET